MILNKVIKRFGLDKWTHIKYIIYILKEVHMNLFDILNRFPNQRSCIDHLERIRFGDEPYCPLCGGMDVAQKKERNRIGRWNCHDCKSSFNVLSKTIMQNTHIPLQKWFCAIGLIVNAKKSLSSYQLARDLNLIQSTAWYMQQRIRAAMASKQLPLLKGIIEADETYVGGRPRRRRNRKDDDQKPKNKRGRGTKKTPVLGAVERSGNVTACVAEDTTGRSIIDFITRTVDPQDSILISDEYQAYDIVRRFMPHSVINHTMAYADGATHTNTIEGFWSLLKRAWYGTHHHYRKHYMPLYVAEACYKYNNRKNENAFGTFLEGCFT